ncbi:hypothetical protein FHP91_16955 [Denitromonas halophila]|uniref:Uncharacterized protein n=1 Tax=Denitromonas halophila TaxID=1629404 RepID=A0A557QKN4_9RHOO|nr:hypothetical protein FHP91_16955 [Denitromonas halophila]
MEAIFVFSGQIVVWSLRHSSNLALNLAPFSRWTLRDKAAQRRLALRWASQKGEANGRVV